MTEGSALMHVTDSDFEQQILKSEVPGTGRFLGRVVWTMQNCWTSSGRACGGVPG